MHYNLHLKIFLAIKIMYFLKDQHLNIWLTTQVHMEQNATFSSAHGSSLFSVLPIPGWWAVETLFWDVHRSQLMRATASVLWICNGHHISASQARMLCTPCWKPISFILGSTSLPSSEQLLFISVSAASNYNHFMLLGGGFKKLLDPLWTILKSDPLWSQYEFNF